VTDVIPLGSPTIGEPELEAIRKVLETGWIAGQGPQCAEFETRFARLCGARHAQATSNCTTALHLALLGLGVGPGDEVLVADYTFPATGHSVLYTGAKPVFVDVRPDIWTIDPAAAEAAITPATKAIIAVDGFGQCADFDELRVIADRHGLSLVEDAATSAGATYKGRPSGSLADVACFSFHARKGITSGEGGALTTDDDTIAAVSRKRSAFGIESALARASTDDLPVPSFDMLGYNYKLSDIAAAILTVQLDRLPELLKARRYVAQRYAELLDDVEGIALPITGDDRDHTWQAYFVTLDEGVSRGEVARYLRERGVQANFGTYSSHLQPVYGDCPPCPVSASLFRRHLAIPMHANLDDAQVERVASTLRDAVRHCSHN
jgi:dTDP-4-amino-4,6-dideoxygalactose transaminase